MKLSVYNIKIRKEIVRMGLMEDMRPKKLFKYGFMRFVCWVVAPVGIFAYACIIILIKAISAKPSWRLKPFE